MSRRRALMGRKKEPNYLFFTLADNSNTVTISTYKSGKNVTAVLEYSFDKVTWYNYTSGNITLNRDNNLTVYWRGNNSTISINASNYLSFRVSNGYIKCGGNIMTLLDYEGKADTVPNYCFYDLFAGGYNGSYEVTDASELVLPAKTVGSYGYYGMFSNQYGLVQGPSSLSATSMGSYACAYMFNACTGLLSTVESLPCTNLPTYAYAYMYNSCTSLRNVLFNLPATTIGTYAYYYMFRNAAITKSPIIYGSPSSSRCFQYMFNGCSNLSEITVYSTSWNTTNANSWVTNVASSGTFKKRSNVSIASGNNGIPSGWTVVNV